MKLRRKKILILCTGNSCRSQMAEGLAREAGWQAFSAGTKPEMEVNPFAVKVMEEIGIDISHHIPQSVNELLDEDFYLVATVCDNAQKSCPVFTGSCEDKIHNDFTDAANTTGSDAEIAEVYRKVRDEIRDWINNLS